MDTHDNIPQRPPEYARDRYAPLIEPQPHLNTLSSQNGHATLAPPMPIDPSQLAEDIAMRFSYAKPIGPGKWTALCPLCGKQPVDKMSEPEGKLMIAIHPETGGVSVQCFGNRCPQDEVLRQVDIDPEHPDLHHSETTLSMPTPAALLRREDVKIDEAIMVLEVYFPRDINNPDHRDPDWVAFLQCFADQYPAFYSALLNLMTEQMWPRDSREAYLEGHNIQCKQAQERGDAPAREPLPLRRETPPPGKFPADALGPVLKPIADCLTSVIQAPYEIAAQSLLAGAGLAVQPHANVTIDGRASPLSEFFLTIGESGERKSAVDQWVLSPHRLYEREQYDKYQKELEGYRNDVEAYKKTREEVMRKKKGREVLKQALDVLGPPPLEPIDPMLTVEEPTYEGLIKTLDRGQPSIGLCSDEGGRMIGGYGMSKDQQLKTAAGLSNLWDGKSVTRIRSGDGNSILFGRRVCMHLMTQPAVANIMLGNDMLRDQGLLSRCLVAWPISTAGSRPYQNVDLSQEPAVREYNKYIRHILDKPLPIVEGKRNTLEPRAIPLTHVAKTIWIKFHDHIEKQLGAKAPYAPIRGLASKAAEHAARLAGILTLVADINAKEIGEEQIAAGIQLMEFYLAEALRIADSDIEASDLILADRLAQWTQQFDYVYLRQIYQKAPTRKIRDKKSAVTIVAVLVDHGRLRPVPGGLELDGAHRHDVWEVIKSDPV